MKCFEIVVCYVCVYEIGGYYVCRGLIGQKLATQIEHIIFLQRNALSILKRNYIYIYIGMSHVISYMLIHCLAKGLNFFTRSASNL